MIGVIYDYHNIFYKRRLWNELLNMKTNLNVPIMLLGDFNEVRSTQERRGYSVLSRSMEEFGEWINDIGLVELPLMGRKYTWRRGLLH